MAFGLLRDQRLNPYTPALEAGSLPGSHQGSLLSFYSFVTPGPLTGCVYVPWAVCPHNTELECSCVFLQAGEEVRSAQKLMSQDFARVPFTLHREEGWTKVCDELAFF